MATLQKENLSDVWERNNLTKEYIEKLKLVQLIKHLTSFGKRCSLTTKMMRKKKKEELRMTRSDLLVGERRGEKDI